MVVLDNDMGDNGTWRSTAGSLQVTIISFLPTSQSLTGLESGA